MTQNFMKSLGWGEPSFLTPNLHESERQVRNATPFTSKGTVPETHLI